MGKIRIVKRKSFDSPPKPYWVIEEIVTSRGHYIEHPGIYATREGAEKEVAKLRKRESGR